MAHLFYKFLGLIFTVIFGRVTPAFNKALEAFQWILLLPLKAFMVFASLLYKIEFFFKHRKGKEDKP